MNLFAAFRRRTATPTPASLPSPSLPATPEATPQPESIAYFRLRTGDGKWLSAGGAEIGTSSRLDAATALIAMVPQSRPNMLFLAAPGLHPIELHMDAMRAPVLSAWSLRTDAASLVRIRHPLSPQYFLGFAEPEQAAADRLTFDTAGGTMRCVFGLQALDPRDVPAGLLSIARELGLATAAPQSQATILALLRTAKIRPELAEPLLRLLPEDERLALAQRLLDEPATLALLRSAMPRDRWLAGPLPALAAWRRDRATVPGFAGLSPPAEQFAAEPFEGLRALDLGGVIQAGARSRITPRHTACILATARNEGAYLLDWIAYHLSIGFEHIFLYTNDNTDGSDALLASLAQAGTITLIRNEAGGGIGPQYKAYAHALQLLPQILDYRWTAVIDLDEFIGLDTTMFANIGEFIAFHETQPVDAIALCWAIFVAGRGQAWSQDSIIARFPRRQEKINAHVKSLFRTARFSQAQAHYPRTLQDTPFVFRTEAGLLHYHPGMAGRMAAFAQEPTAKLAWINHYLLKTAPEALWKRARSRGDWTAAFQPRREREHDSWLAISFLSFLHEGTTVEDTRILAAAAGHAAMLARLLALPGVAEHHARIKADFAERLRETVANFLGRRLQGDETAEMMEFRDMVQNEH